VVLKASVARQADCTLCEPPWIETQEGGGKDSSQNRAAGARRFIQLGNIGPKRPRQHSGILSREDGTFFFLCAPRLGASAEVSGPPCERRTRR
jgi:hypothetical protein